MIKNYWEAGGKRPAPPSQTPGFHPKPRAPSGLGWFAIMLALWIATLLVITMLIIPYARSFGTCAAAPGAPYYSTTNGAEIGRCPK